MKKKEKTKKERLKNRSVSRPQSLLVVAVGCLRKTYLDDDGVGPDIR